VSSRYRVDADPLSWTPIRYRVDADPLSWTPIRRSRAAARRNAL